MQRTTRERRKKESKIVRVLIWIAVVLVVALLVTGWLFFKEHSTYSRYKNEQKTLQQAQEQVYKQQVLNELNQEGYIVIPKQIKIKTITTDDDQIVSVWQGELKDVNGEFIHYVK